MEDPSFSQAVPIRTIDRQQVPDQPYHKSQPVGSATQQGEFMASNGQPSNAELQQELKQMKQQINVLQHQLQDGTSPGSPLPHQVPQVGQITQYQQVPHSPQFPHQQQQQPLGLQQNAQHQPHAANGSNGFASNGEQVLRKDRMMSYLMDCLNQGVHIGHYGQLIFAMIAHHFMTEHEVIQYLMKDPSMDVTEAQNMYRQVQAKDYNPPRKEKILEWQSQQQFKIIPDNADSEFGNVYKDLTFPEHVYSHITEYYQPGHNK